MKGPAKEENRCSYACGSQRYKGEPELLFGNHLLFRYNSSARLK